MLHAAEVTNVDYLEIFALYKQYANVCGTYTFVEDQTVFLSDEDGEYMF